MKEKLMNIVKFTLVALFLSYYLSATCFYHTHYFTWGVVTHSHLYFPVDKNAVDHTHTQKQCQVISYLSHIVMLCFSLTVFFHGTACVRRLHYFIRFYIPQILSVFQPLRAPPVFLSQ
ncbi:MAG: hypothetical protein LBQ78_03760 [Tannerellaceae bacterium]|jgi:hypothetical protein|nr:hypothetical protein [Tannerellaceae bacterium]